jgi:CRISPR-associated endonuclease/helicase Cas3
MDVALTLRALCDVPGMRRALRRSAGANLSERQLDRLAVLGMLHDIGKANWGFQHRVLGAPGAPAGHIRELAPLLDPEAADPDLQEAFLNALPPELATWFGSDRAAYSYLLATFSHHGRPLRFRGEQSGTYWPARREWWRTRHGKDPMDAIRGIVDSSRTAFPAAFLSGGEPLPSQPAFHHRFAGLLMLADWLGSHPHWFPIEETPTGTRLHADRGVLQHLLPAIGLDPRALRPRLDLGAFVERFGFNRDAILHPIQTAVDALDPDHRGAGLVVAEAETGSGKTEAALDWFWKLLTAGKVDGLYFALPTRVAAGEIYRRVMRVLDLWFPDPTHRPVALLAVPGYAQVDGVVAEKVLPEEETAQRWADDETERRRARQWAAERPKRFLAATVAVGTIDQALLSVVQTKHAHLRSVCLDRSLLVVDEVHASDTYMSRLLEALLRHHLQGGGHALLLSATLGASARHRYLAAAGSMTPPPSAEDATSVPYPVLTLANGETPRLEDTVSRTKTVRFEAQPLAFDIPAIATTVREALAAGARVLAVLNTVQRANAVLRAVEGLVGPGCLFACRGVVCPHHGRFAPEDRLVLDQAVSRRLGPGTPPGPVLLVGTQTLEQSLDIDADLLVTDLCPADVLLQRVGRLHRHDRARPAAFSDAARCIVLTPPESMAEGLDEHGRPISAYRRAGLGSVYEDLRVLELTRRLVTDNATRRIPQDNRALVEGATHPEQLASLRGQRWERHAQQVEGGDLARALTAGHVTIDFDQFFGEFEFNELGGSVSARLGTDRLQLPLEEPITSPFGQLLREITIPGHMAPSVPAERVTVEALDPEGARLRCADRVYRYSRFGLEVVE